MTQKLLAFGAVAAIALLAMFGVKDKTEETASRKTDNRNNFAITDVRVFDGENIIKGGTVVVKDGMIAAVGTGAKVPAGFTEVDGAGKTLLPGLIDAHTHTYGSALNDSLRFGVTTNLDMFTDPSLFQAEKPQRESGNFTTKADMFSAGMLATIEGGHGTEYPVKVETLSTPEEADSWVERRVAEGSDYIKLVYMPYQPVFPSLDKATAAALIDAAHKRGLLAVTHVFSMKGAEDMLDAGTDGLVHVFADRLVTPEFAKRAADAGMFVIPTATVIGAIGAEGTGKILVKDKAIEPFLTEEQKINLSGSFGQEIPGFKLEYAIENVRRLHEAGVVILAGTDAPNMGTTHGASLHQELGLLADAGMTPVEVLKAVTSATAKQFRLEGRGVLKEGVRADMLLVNGNPFEDIAATKDIALVYKNGFVISREPKKSGLETKTDLPSSLMDFSEGLLLKAGFKWVATDDSMIGGKSEAAIKREDEGIRVDGSINPGFAYPWSGAMLAFSEAFNQPYDFTSKAKISFQIRGSEGTYRTMLFRPAGAGIPSMQPFNVTGEWQTVELDIKGFRNINLAKIAGLSIVAGKEGSFWIEVKEMQIN